MSLGLFVDLTIGLFLAKYSICHNPHKSVRSAYFASNRLISQSSAHLNPGRIVSNLNTEVYGWCISVLPDVLAHLVAKTHLGCNLLRFTQR